MKHLIAIFSLVAAGAAYAVAPAMPRVTDLNVVDEGRTVTISYKLADAPGVVTLDIQTNDVATGAWASIGGENVAQTLAGAVGTYVENGDAVRTITWCPRKAWPGHRFANKTAKAVLTAWPTNDPPTFMVVDLTNADKRFTYYADKASVPGGITNRIYKTDKILLRKIPAAGVMWNMGMKKVTGSSPLATSNEDLHPVTLTEDYYMAVYETTCQQYDYVRQYAKKKYGVFNEWCNWTGTTWKQLATSDYDSYYDAETIKTCPVKATYYFTLRGLCQNADPQMYNVIGYNWPADGHTVISNGFFGALRTMTGGCVTFDLPTEAQWEFAARAGTSTQTYFGDPFPGYWGGHDDALLDQYCWWEGNSAVIVETTTSRTAHPVGLKLPNAFDLYDTIGNVFEACLDQYQASLGFDSVADPIGPTTDAENPARVFRGGAACPENWLVWYSQRSSWRYSTTQKIDDNLKWGYDCFGFRIWAPAVVAKPQ